MTDSLSIIVAYTIAMRGELPLSTQVVFWGIVFLPSPPDKRGGAFEVVVSGGGSAHLKTNL